MKSLAHPKRMRLIALASSIQKAGFDALPLIAIMTFFIGAVVALIGSDLLKTLGASELVVELVGISVLREFGVLIPAILLAGRSEEHTSELQSLLRISYAVFYLSKKIIKS